MFLPSRSLVRLCCSNVDPPEAVGLAAIKARHSKTVSDLKLVTVRSTPFRIFFKTSIWPLAHHIVFKYRLPSNNERNDFLI
jgi:hypothetical protein